MGYYKDTGSLQSMASAEAILKKRMPEKVGILPVAELLFVAESIRLFGLEEITHGFLTVVSAGREIRSLHLTFTVLSGVFLLGC